MESDLVEVRCVEGPDRIVLAMFPCPEDVIPWDNDGRIVTKKVIACMQKKREEIDNMTLQMTVIHIRRTYIILIK